MARKKLHLKTWKNWKRLSEDEIGIEYYRKGFLVGKVGLSHYTVLGVFQGVIHGPGPARKHTRDFYILLKSLPTLKRMDPDGVVRRVRPKVQLAEVRLPKGKSRSVWAHSIERGGGAGSWRRWARITRASQHQGKTPQYIATKLLEASKGKSNPATRKQIEDKIALIEDNDFWTEHTKKDFYNMATGRISAPWQYYSDWDEDDFGEVYGHFEGKLAQLELDDARQERG